MTAFIYFLNDFYDVLSVTGPDAQHFLQGQCTQDLALITEKQAHWGAFCQLQGRVLALSLILSVPDGYWLILPKAMIAPLIKHLSRYKMRSKVIIEPLRELHSIVGFGGDLLPSHILRPDQPLQIEEHLGIKTLLLPGLPARVLMIGPPEAIKALNQKCISHTPDDWFSLQIQSGTAEITPGCSGLFTALSLNYLELGAICLTKGCYLGQEIIARMHYRSKTIKETLFQLSGEWALQPQPGHAVWLHSGNSPQLLGHIVSGTHNTVLAVLQTALLPQNSASFSGWIVPAQAQDTEMHFLIQPSIPMHFELSHIQR